MKFLLFLSALLYSVVPILAQAPVGGASVANSPTLNGQITYRHLYIATVLLPNNVTAQQVWAQSSVASYLTQSVVYRNWSGAATARTAGTNQTSNVIDDLINNKISVRIYADNPSSLNTLTINRFPLLNVTEAKMNTQTALDIRSLSNLYADFAKDTETSVAFINSSNLTYSTIGSWLDQGRAQGVPDNITFFFAFVPVTPSSQIVPNFIYGYNIKGGNDTYAHTETNVADMLVNAFNLKSNRTVASSVTGVGARAHKGALKKIFQNHRHQV